MKKLALVSTVVLAFAACQKDNNDNTAAVTTNKFGSWTMGGTTYYVNNTTISNEFFYVYDTAGNGLSFTFDTAVQAVPSGNYAVVAGLTSPAGQVKVAAFDANRNGNTYFSTGTDHVVANVTTADGRIKTIALPATRAARSNASDSTTITANIGPF